MKYINPSDKKLFKGAIDMKRILEKHLQVLQQIEAFIQKKNMAEK